MRTAWIRHVLALAGTAALAFVLTPSAVLADCMMPAPVQEAVKTADIVFVGVVTETSNQDRWASVAVESVWGGADIPATVVVKGGSGGGGISSVDRQFKAGMKYLFFPYADDQGNLADNLCTNTIEWTDDLEQLQPADVRPPLGAIPTDSGMNLDSVIAPLAVALLVGGGLLLVGLLARGRTA